MATRMARSLEKRMTNDMRPISLLGPCEDTAIELPVRFSCDRTGLAATGVVPNGTFLEPPPENQTLKTLPLLVILRRANPRPDTAGLDPGFFFIIANPGMASSSLPRFLWS